jgi:opacity protein-like surface antigen
MQPETTTPRVGARPCRTARLILALTLVASLALIVAVPATAATASQTPTPVQTGTWVGRINEHDGHFDYQGSACPVEQDVCIKILATYRIVPITRQAAMALPGVAGGSARLSASLASVADDGHLGTLFVWKVSRA